MHRSAAVQRNQIIWILRRHPEGLTHDAIDNGLGWPHPRAARRMRELQKAGLVGANGLGTTSSGRAATLYVATRVVEA